MLQARRLLQVIEGARKTLGRCRSAIFLENDTVERSREVLMAVESVGRSKASTTTGRRRMNGGGRSGVEAAAPRQTADAASVG